VWGKLLEFTDECYVILEVSRKAGRGGGLLNFVVLVFTSRSSALLSYHPTHSNYNELGMIRYTTCT
jgi:hypothetical protein